jgi:bacteriocin biosynthesis cyclodehydratase domain-containing protein
MKTVDETHLLDIRPRLRNDVVFLRVETGIYLRSSETTCVLKGPGAYEWMSVLGPRLTGESTIAELCEGLDEKRRRTAVGLIRTLLDRGFARDLPKGDSAALPEPVAELFAPQVNFVEHFMHGHDLTPQELFARFRATRVLVAGPPGPVAVAAVRGLLRNGLAHAVLEDPRWEREHAGEFDADLALLDAAGAPADVVMLTEGDVHAAGFDVVVCAVEAAGAATLLRLTERLAERSARTAGGGAPRLVPVVLDGARAVMGPISGPAEQPCWLCAALRLSANSDPRLTADFWRGLALGTKGDGNAGRDTAAGTIAQGMIGNALAFDVFRLRTGQLGADDEAHAVIQDLTTLESHRERVLPHPACPMPHTSAHPKEIDFHAPADDKDAYGRAAFLVSPGVGVLADWADEDVRQIPIKTGRVRLGPAGHLADGVREITAYDVETILAARTRAVRAAVSAYVGRLGPSGGTAETEAETAAQARIAPEQLALHVGTPDGSAATTTWLPATSLHDGTLWQVPAAAVHPLSAANGDLRFEPSAAGAAAGWTFAEVQERGLCSALAHRGLTEAITGAAPAAPLDEAWLAEDEDVAFALGSLRHIGRTARVYALPGAGPVRAVLAVVDAPQAADSPDAPATPADDTPHWSVAAALDTRTALREAVLDAAGAAVDHHKEGTRPDLGDPLLTDFDPRVLTAGGPAPDWSHDDPAVPLADVLAHLHRQGTRALFADTTTIDLKAARGLVTGTVLLARSQPA